MLIIPANSSVGTHFKLREEQSWEKADSVYLDAVGLGKLTNLSLSLSTIPFHIQMNMPENFLPVRNICLHFKARDPLGSATCLKMFYLNSILISNVHGKIPLFNFSWQKFIKHNCQHYNMFHWTGDETSFFFNFNYTLDFCALYVRWTI